MTKPNARILLLTATIINFTLAGTSASAQQFRVKITTGLTTFYDETMVHFGIGVPTIDPNDIPKMGLGGGAAPGIASVSADGADLMFNAHGPVGGDIAVPIKVTCGISGAYALSIYDMAGLIGGSCVTLEDLYTQTLVPITQGMAYNYTMSTTDPVDPPRFLIHLTAPLTGSVVDASCSNSPDGSISVPVVGQGPWNVQWTDAQMNIIDQQNVIVPPIVLQDQPAGTAVATIAHPSGCVQQVTATIGAGPGPVASFTSSSSQVPVNEPIFFANTSTPGATLMWDFGDGTTSSDAEPVHAYAQAGFYQVALTATDMACSATATQQVEVQAVSGIGTEAAIDAAVFIQADRIMVSWSAANDALNAELFSASGRSVTPVQRSLNSNSPLYIGTNGLPAGGYVLRVWNSSAMRSFLVPLAR